MYYIQGTMLELDIVEPEMMIFVWILSPRTRHSNLSPASIRLICSLHTSRRPPFSREHYSQLQKTCGMSNAKLDGQRISFCAGTSEETEQRYHLGSLPPCTRQAEPVRNWASIRGKVLALMPVFLYRVEEVEGCENFRFAPVTKLIFTQLLCPAPKPRAQTGSPSHAVPVVLASGWCHFDGGVHWGLVVLDHLEDLADLQPIARSALGDHRDPPGRFGSGP